MKFPLRFIYITLFLLTLDSRLSAQTVYLGHSFQEVKQLLHGAAEEKLERIEESYDFGIDSVTMFGIGAGRARIGLDKKGNVSDFIWKSSSDETIPRDSGIKIIEAFETRVGPRSDELIEPDLFARFWTFGKKQIVMKATFESVYYQEFYRKPKPAK